MRRSKFRFVVEAHRSLSRSDRLASAGKLAAGVAHEVGNPLAAILSYAELTLRDKSLSAGTREDIERIRGEALRIRTLVRDLLNLTRPEALELVPHRPEGLLEHTAERMRPQKILSGIRLAVTAEPDLPAVRVDARRVEQILVNLIENAAHAVRGQAEAQIKLDAYLSPQGFQRSRRTDDLVRPLGGSGREAAVVLAVTDNGPGIDLEHQPHIFDPFFTTKDPGDGTGLGLWNAHRLAELLGGRLEVESHPGRTCLSLLLPTADTEPADVQSPNSDH